MPGKPADHDPELGLVIDAPAAPRVRDRIAGTDHRGRRLQEDDRLLRDPGPHLLRVFEVVAPHRDDLRRDDRSQEPHAGERNLFTGRDGVLEERPLERRDELAVDGSSGDAIAVPKPGQPHEGGGYALPEGPSFPSSSLLP